MHLSIREICEATGGTYTGNNAEAVLTGVSIDSREDQAGKLFAAIQGARADGHDFAAQAIAKGAVAALVERDVQRISADGHAGAPPQIKVASTRKALTDLAAYHRARFAGPVVAITGSAGKTTTKDLLASVLSQKFKTHKTQGNFNNDLGLPLTLLARPADAQAMVLEMGMNHGGEIRALSRLGRPDIALITNIGDAHIENLGSRANILKAKCEIFEGLRPGGIAVMNGQDPLLSALPPIPVAERTVYCGRETDAIRASQIRPLGLDGTACRLHWQRENPISFDTHIPIPGDHMVMNAQMAAAVGLLLGLDTVQIDAGIRAFTPSGHRMAIIHSTQGGGMTLINDTYNASPPAMYAAIDMLAEVQAPRRVCVLGDMFELGEHAPQMHASVGQYATARKMDLLIAIGPLARHLYDAFEGEKQYFATKEAFIDVWAKHLRPGDAVLVKASRGMALETVVDALR